MKSLDHVVNKVARMGYKLLAYEKSLKELNLAKEIEEKKGLDIFLTIEKKSHVFALDFKRMIIIDPSPNVYGHPILNQKNLQTLNYWDPPYYKAYWWIKK